MRTRFVWGRLGTLLIQEGADPIVAEMFYREVVQAILMYGSETWVLLAEMERKVKGVHTCFSRHIMGKQERQVGDRVWEMPGVEVLREAAGTQSEMTYIGIRQENLAQWVALQQLFEVCEG